MMILEQLGMYLLMGFLGFWVGVIITCIILVKKNGAQYAEIQKEVRNEKYVSSEGDTDEDEEDAECGSDNDSVSDTVLSDAKETEV